MKKRHLIWIISIGVLILAIGGFFIYTSFYYHADSVAFEACKSTNTVKVTKKDSYYFFDSENEKEAVILYPGAKVEVEAYAPLCMNIADKGLDVFLVDMPFHFAFFGMNRANSIIDNYNYEHFYVGGHSLGGAIAAKYAYNNTDKVDGVVMLASYTVDRLDEKLNNVLIYGSNDKVLNKQRYTECLPYATNYTETIIEGGNHAGFGYYGNQKGDGELEITRESQIDQTATVIYNKIHK